MIGAILAGGAVASSLAGSYFNYQQSKKQRWSDKKWQGNFARKGMQWRVKDLEAAGLSPVLATGMSPMAPQKLSPMGRAEGISEGMLNALTLLKMDTDISRTKAEEQYINMQKDKARIERDILQHDYNIVDKAGVRYNNPSNAGRNLTDFVGILNGPIGQELYKIIMSIGNEIDRAGNTIRNNRVNKIQAAPRTREKNYR